MTRFTLEHESFDTNRDRAKAFDTLFNLALEEPKINSYFLDKQSSISSFRGKK